MGPSSQITQDINGLRAEIIRLRQENQMLRRKNQDLELSLITTVEHGDSIEAELYETNSRLKSEITERLKAEATLQALLQIVSAEKKDLEIIVQTIMEHGDVLDYQWHEKFVAATRLADVDGLTQIANRRRFEGDFEQQWQYSLKHHTPLALILCDIDHFKAYNDAYGHLAGDECLKLIAHTLSQNIHRVEDLVARYGGEEFVILLPQTTLEGALKVAHRLQQAIAHLAIAHGQSQVAEHVTLSMGIASWVAHAGITRNDLLMSADQLLYQAKQQGKNQIVYRMMAAKESWRRI
jgi:diguanylate cyclase (GGDEF)-like protein